MSNVPQTPCISFAIPAVQLPSILIPSVQAGLTFPPPPTVDGIPCCKFKVPSFTVTLPLPPLPIGTIMAAINAALLAAQSILPTVQVPQCNL